MKKSYILFLIALSLILTVLMITVASAQETAPAASRKDTKDLEYKKSGFQIGGQLSFLGGMESDALIILPGKLDFLVGYKINPYVTCSLDLWTFWLLAYAAEAHVKVNLLDANVSPYIVGTAGILGALTLADDDGEEMLLGGMTYSAGAGADFRVWKKQNVDLFTELRYRGVAGLGQTSGVSTHGVELGLGVLWKF